MSDLIERHALIKEISKYHLTSGIPAQATWNACVDIIIEALESFPSAQPVTDCISRQQAIDLLKRWSDGYSYIEVETNLAIRAFEEMPSAQPEDWMERNKERILQAGMEGREIEFRIGGRLFAIREKAQ